MTENAPARPPQVTMAGWLTIVGSAFLVFTVFDLVANLGSLETRTSVKENLSQPPLDGLGFDVEQALNLLHLASLVAAGCATAAAILGWQVLRRNRAARVVLSVVVVPLFLAGAVTGGFLAAMVAVAVVMLWSRPARDWFDGINSPQASDSSRPDPFARTPQQQPAATDQSAAPARPDQPVASARPDRPPPYTGFGTPTEGSLRSEALTGAGRPPQVAQACALVWIFGSMIVVGAIFGLTALALDSGTVEELYASDPRLAESGLDVDTIRSVAMVTFLVVLAWTLAAVLLAVFAFRGSNGARIALLVSAAVAALVCLPMAFSAPPVLLIALPCVVAIFLLTRPVSNAWYADGHRTHPDRPE